MQPLLAKPDTLLLDHLLEVAHLGAQIAERLGLSELLRAKALLACALHDVGKATVDFQEHIRGQRKQAYPHALASMPFVLMAERLVNAALGLDPERLEATAAVLSHHSPLSARLYLGYGAPRYCPEIQTLLESLWASLSAFGIRRLPSFESLQIQQILELMRQNSPAALLDDRGIKWGRDERTLRGLLQSLPTMDFAQVKAVLHLADWLASGKRNDPGILFLSGGRAAVERHIQGLRAPLRAFQKESHDAADANVLWLRAPTGTGKTEALLLWAGDAERLIYLLPTQATANAMWRRLRRIYGEEAVSISHGRAAYMLRREADEPPLDVRLFGSAFARPVIVATLDQYLLAHLHGRHWEERRALSRRAALILDEIHAYEPYTLGLLLAALGIEKPTKLAIASATLPEALLQRFAEIFPNARRIEAERALWERKRHRIERPDGQLVKDGVEVALREAGAGKRVLVVANTVRDAQAFYEGIHEAGWERRALLHARFVLRDRAQKEFEAERPEPGYILVATQVIEVSLDVSFDVLITEVAPIDALVQRMGRVNRRGEAPAAPVRVFTTWSEGAQRVYSKEVLERSREILVGLSETPSDADLAEAVHQLYDYITGTAEWKQELEDGRRTLLEIQRTLGCYTIDLSEEEMRDRFTARRGMVSVEVLPQSLLQEAYALKERGEGWRLPELLVPVPIYWFAKYKGRFSTLSDLNVVQADLPYDAEYGVRIEDADSGYVIM